MKRRAAIVTASIVAIGGLGSIPGAVAADKARVKAVDFVFEAEKVKIRKGGKVTWVFKEGRHNVTGKGWKSPTKTSGTYSRVFKKVGKYKYRCTLHQPDMDGVVKVVR